MREDIHAKSIKPLINGEGQNVIICFHGFGQAPKVYSKLIDRKGEYTIYSFPLPCSISNINLIYNHKEYRKGYFDSFKQFLDKNDIHQFEIVSFSIGAKVGLCLAEEFPSMISRVILLAPDGIVKRAIYQIATNNFLGRLFFFITVNYAFFLVKYICRVALIFRLIPKNFNQLVEYYSSDKKKRMLIFNTWLNCRYFIPNLKTLVYSITDNAVKLELILAEKDSVIKNKHVRPLLKLFPKIKPKVLSTTHEKLIPTWINSLK